MVAVVKRGREHGTKMTAPRRTPKPDADTDKTGADTPHGQTAGRPATRGQIRTNRRTHAHPGKRAITGLDRAAAIIRNRNPGLTNAEVAEKARV